MQHDSTFKKKVDSSKTFKFLKSTWHIYFNIDGLLLLPDS